MKDVSSIQAILETHSESNAATRSSVARYFRDAQSRTRIEHGDIASIHDPVSGQSFVLNPATKVAIPGAPKPQGMPALKVPQLPGAPPASAPEFKETADLGEKTIEGMKVSGKEFSAPIQGKPEPLKGEVWTSHELGLPIQSVVKDPSSGTTLKTEMKNVQSGVKLDPGMFQVPPDFKIASRA